MPAWQYNAESNISCCLISHNGASILVEQGLVGGCPANVEDAYWVHLVMLVVIVHRPTSMTGLMSSAGNGVGVSWESSLRRRQKLESVLLLRKHPSVWHRLSHCSFDWFLSVCHSTFYCSKTGNIVLRFASLASLWFSTGYCAKSEADKQFFKAGKCILETCLNSWVWFY
jgi:hypothetical protein